VLLDVFSRYVVGWLLARQESAALAKVLIAESCERQQIAPDKLIIHADRGPSMTSQPVALLLATLGVVPSPLPAPRLRRQPLFRGPVQDAQVPAGLPGPVRRLR
jgi:transposase InsO family protein